MPSLTVFLDASVILSGLASATGGSRKILVAGKAKKLKLLTSVYILQEVAEHLAKLKIEKRELLQLLSQKIILVLPSPEDQFVEKFKPIVTDPDDAHVLAAAVLSGAKMLISLDKKHILTKKVRKTLKPILVMPPKQFWLWLGRKK